MTKDPRNAQKVLKFLREFHKEHDRLPTTYEVAAHFNWASNSSAYHHIKTLVADGWLERTPKGYRFTRRK